MINSIIRNPGYYKDLVLSQLELNILIQIIRKQYLKNIFNYNPNIIDIFRNSSLSEYHLHSHLLDHNKIWTKINRTLNSSDLKIVENLSFYSKLKENFGDFFISDEDNIGHGEIYWRLARPDVVSDVGDLHADYMFWEYRKDPIPKNTKRVKIWIGLITEPGKNGFIFIPNSHLNEISYSIEIKNNRTIFKINNLHQFEKPQLFNSTPGKAIIFNDKLIHGGKLGGDFTRVSIEFTLLVKNI